MQPQRLKRLQLPQIYYQKKPSISSVFNLIKMKKKQFILRLNGQSFQSQSPQQTQQTPPQKTKLINNFPHNQQYSENHSHEIEQTTQISRVKLQRNPVYSYSSGIGNEESSSKQSEFSHHSFTPENKLNSDSNLSKKPDIVNIKKLENVLEEKAIRNSIIFPGSQQYLYNRKKLSNNSIPQRYKVQSSQKNKTEVIESADKDMLSQEALSEVNEKQQNHFSLENMQKDAKDQFKKLFPLVPKHFKNRNQENLGPIIQQLEKFNPFFNRIDKVITICFLKMGNLVYRDTSSILYRANETVSHFYIVLFGKVKLTMGSQQHHQKKIAHTGETLLEQMLFQQKPKRCSLQKCKIIGGTYLLEIRIEQYKKIKEELIKFGYRMAMIEMESILKRNFIVKNWIRNKFKDS